MRMATLFAVANCESVSWITGADSLKGVMQGQGNEALVFNGY